MRAKGKPVRSASIATIVMMLSFMSLFVSTRQASAAYTPHAPIYIEGDFSFTSANGVAGGSGTVSDPFIIEGWDINASAETGIQIRNTAAHFIIRNSYVHSGLHHGGTRPEDKMTGILFLQVSNGRIENVTVSENRFGIYMHGSTNISVSGNMILGNGRGIVLSKSSRMTITLNTFVSDGITIWGNKVEDFDSHAITLDNSVNGKSLYYYKDCSDLNVTAVPVGQLIVANCRKVSVQNLTVNDTDIGLEMAFVSDVVVANNSLSGNAEGASFYESTNTTFMGNLVDSNRYSGLLVEFSRNLTVRSNIATATGKAWPLYATEGDGVSISSVTTAVITDNDVSANTMNGISVVSSSDVMATNNTVYANRMDGLRFLYCSRVSVVGSDVFLNVRGVSVSYSSIGYVANNYAVDNDMGISISYSNGFSVLNNSAALNSLEGFALQGVANSSVRGNEGLDNGFEGFLFLGGRNITVAGNDAVGNHGEGFSILGAVDASLVGNNASRNDDAGFLISSSSVAVIGNDASLNGISGLDIGYSDNVTVANNLVQSNSALGVRIGSSNDTRLVGNTVTQSMQGISLFKSGNITIADNIMANHSVAIDLVSFLTNIAVTNNTVSLCWRGISVGGPSIDVNISRNTIISSTGDGIYISSSDVAVTDNQLLGGWSGIVVELSGKVDVAGNWISMAESLGMGIRSSSNVTVTHNLLDSNNRGLEISLSQGIVVHHNRFVTNGNQAYDDGINTWDDGYPSGGNHWSNYVGEDRCRGPRQDMCTGPDGIGDTPMVIDPDSADHYPLTSSLADVDNPPTAVASGSMMAFKRTPVLFDGSGSSDDIGIVSYLWDFGDGTNAAGETVTHEFSKAGILDVTLMVWDARSQNDSDSFMIEIPNRPPTADAGRDVTAMKHSQAVLNGARSFDPDGDPLTFSWVQVNGTSVVLDNAAAVFPAFTPQKPGTYMFELTVDDGDGGVARDVVTVTVWGLPPEAILKSSHSTAEVGSSITFDGGESIDPDGAIVDYSFDFGDGSRANGTTALANHFYPALGVYTVTLTVTDDDGNTSSVWTTVTVVMKPTETSFQWWIPALLIVVAMVAILGWLLLRRRGGRKPQAVH